jgi:hypothetical protein
MEGKKDRNDNLEGRLALTVRQEEGLRLINNQTRRALDMILVASREDVMLDGLNIPYVAAFKSRSIDLDTELPNGEISQDYVFYHVTNDLGEAVANYLGGNVDISCERNGTKAKVLLHGPEIIEILRYDFRVTPPLRLTGELKPKTYSQ